MNDGVVRKRIGGGFKIVEPKGDNALKKSSNLDKVNKKLTDSNNSIDADDEHEEQFSGSSYDESGEDDVHRDKKKIAERKLPKISKNGRYNLTSKTEETRTSFTDKTRTDKSVVSNEDDGFFEKGSSGRHSTEDDSSLKDSHEDISLPPLPVPKEHSKEAKQKDKSKHNYEPDDDFEHNVSESKGKSDKAVNLPKPTSDYDVHPILRHIQNSVIGGDLVIETPFGQREVVYCDYTASGRSLAFIEDYIRTHVLPNYANTHSTTGHNARQTGKFREEARSIIKKCVNAGKDDVVIFTGSGATAGINKIAWALKMNYPRVAMDTAVFIGPYEHHSNILVWRELGTKVVRIRHNPNTGLIDLQHLDSELQFWKEKRRNLLVCMSAASNVTGIITDVDAVSSIAHQHGALAIFDYAAGGPYLKIDMNPKRGEYKDVVVLSPHKFVGGPGTPGLIIAKKWIFRNSVPDRVGGGTVRFVTREQHAYVSNIEEKEEGGTPAIIESIRAGIVFKLKETIGSEVIYRREEELCNRAFTVWEKNPCIYVMGSHTAHRVPIFSFLTVHEETGRLVHHNFISTLLSDLYGIQARGGCACAGPYAEDLMGISEPLARKYMWFLSERPPWHDKNGPPLVPMEIMKPGFTRINLAYFLDNETVDFVIQAVDDVTRYGWKLLPQYTFDIHSGSWKHKSMCNRSSSDLESLEQFDVEAGFIGAKSGSKPSPSLQDVLTRAKKLYESADFAQKPRISSASQALREALPEDKRKLKWFLTPHEARIVLADKEKTYLEHRKYKLPFNLMNNRPRSDASDSDHGYHSDQSSHVQLIRERQRRSYISPERRRRAQKMGIGLTKIQYNLSKGKKPVLPAINGRYVQTDDEDTGPGQRRLRPDGYQSNSEQFVTKIAVSHNT